MLAKEAMKVGLLACNHGFAIFVSVPPRLRSDVVLLNCYGCSGTLDGTRDLLVEFTLD